MPIEYEVEAERGLVQSRASGVLSSEQMLAHVRALASDAAVPRPLYEIWDGTEVERLDAWGTNVRGFLNAAVTAKQKFGSARLAIIAPSQLVYGLGRMAQSLADFTPYRIGVFRRREDAVAWMDQRIRERDGLPAEPAAAE